MSLYSRFSASYLLCIALCLLFCHTSTEAQTIYDWTGNQNNNWDNGSNWTGASGWPDDPTHIARFDSANYGTNDVDVDTRGGTFDILNLSMGQADELLTFRSSTGNPGMIRIHGNVNFNNNNAADTGPHDFFTDLEVVNASTWTAGEDHYVDIYGVLSGSGTITATANGAGAGLLQSRWRSANTFDGTLIIDNVIVDLRHRNAFEHADVVINHNDGLRVDDLFNQTINIRSLSGTGLFDFKTNHFVTTSNTNTTFSGTLQSTGSNSAIRNFTKAGTGILTLSGNITNFGTLFNTGGGEVEITSGGDWQRLEVDSGLVDIRNGASVDLESNDTNVFYMNGGGNAFIRDGADVTLTGTATSPTPRVVQTGTSLINVNGDGSTLTTPRISVGPSGGGDPLFVVQDDGAVDVTDFEIGDSGTDNGSTSVVSASSGGSIDADLITLFLRGALWVNGGQVTTDQLVVNGSTENMRITDGAPGAALVIGGSGGSSTFNNVIEDNIPGAGSIRKEGAGTLTLGGANTFSGGITLNGGTLGLAHDNAAGTGPITVLGSTIDYADGVDIANAVDLHNNVTLNVTTGSATQSGTIGETGGSFDIMKSGAGTLTLAAANTFTGTTDIDAGQLVVNHAAALQHSTVSINNDDGLDVATHGIDANIGALTGTGALDLAATTLTTGSNGSSTTHSGAITGLAASELSHNGAGTLTLTGNISGVTRLRAADGDLVLSGNTANLNTGGPRLSASGGNLTLESGATVDLNVLGIVPVGSGSTMTVTGPGTALTNAAQLDLTTGTGSGHVLVTDSASIFDFDNINIARLGTASLTASDDASVATNSLDLGGIDEVTNGGNAAMTVDSGATATVTGRTKFWSDTSELTVDEGNFSTGTLANHTGVVATISISDAMGGTALTIGTDDGDSTFDGLIQDAAGGAGSLLKTGSGTLTLTAANTYSGTTNIDGGTLLANSTAGSATGTGGVTVSSGGTLGGTGSSAGTTTVNSGGTLAPGASTGVLTVDDLLLNTGSTFAVELAGSGGVAGTDFDQLVVNNSATLGGDFAIDLLGDFSPGSSDTFTVLTSTALSGTFDNVANAAWLDTLGGEGSFLVSYDGITNSIVLSKFVFALAGDFNGDGVVDAADYTMWRDNLGALDESALHGNGDGMNGVDPGDYTLWVGNFGAVLGSAAIGIAAVPEPAAVAMLWSAAFGVFFVLRTHSRR